MDGYLGVDVGSVTAKCAVITEAGELSPITTYVLRVSRSLSDCRDSGKLKDSFPSMSGSVADMSKYGPLPAGYILAEADNRDR